MGTASFQFLAFAAIAAIVYNLFAALAWRRAALLVTSLFFLGTFYAGPRSFLPLLGFLLLGYAGLRVTQRRAHYSFLPLVIAIIAVYVWLKKYSFLPEIAFLRFPYVTIGLSYIFFRVLHLIIESRGNNLPSKIGLISYLNYMLNFTTLVSGPIQTYQDFEEMQSAPVRPALTVVIAGEALERIVVGFFKVNVLSVALWAMRQHALTILSRDLPFTHRILVGILIAVSYPLYLFCNFSGYIDMVIGIARFLRLKLPENFDRPFSADNFINFWSRWHITLSNWLRNYVYNPLLMTLMRRFPSPAIEPFWAVLAFFVTFFLIGIWHGRTSEFVVFGVAQGLGVSANKLYQIVMARTLGRKGYRVLAARPVYVAFARGLTFSWFTFSLFWFWSNWNQMAFMKQAMGGGAIAVTWAAIFFGATVVLAVYEALRAWVLSFEWEGQPLVLSRFVRTVWNTALATISIVVVVILNAPAPEIVYKAF